MGVEEPIVSFLQKGLGEPVVPLSTIVKESCHVVLMLFVESGQVHEVTFRTVSSTSDSLLLLGMIDSVVFFHVGSDCTVYNASGEVSDHISDKNR